MILTVKMLPLRESISEPGESELQEHLVGAKDCFQDLNSYLLPTLTTCSSSRLVAPPLEP